MKGLEAFEEIKAVMSKLFGDVEKCNKSLDIIEKELKALEIIKEKRVNAIILFHYSNYKTPFKYNRCIMDHDRQLTQKEYDLLKEVLNND